MAKHKKSIFKDGHLYYHFIFISSQLKKLQDYRFKITRYYGQFAFTNSLWNKM